MRTEKIISGAIIALTMVSTGCNNSTNQQNKTEMEQVVTNVALPTTDKWVKSPVRNRLVIELNKSISEVWALVGDPANMPKFSAGLDSVTTKTKNGKCTLWCALFVRQKV